MKRSNLAGVVLLVLVGSQHLLSSAPAGQALQSPAGGVPMFELDPNWPKIPQRWKLGDVVSIGIDAQNHVLLLHRPRTLPAEQASMTAPPIVEFDLDGNFIKAWGGSGAGYQWPEREHGIHVDHRGNIWIGGNNCPGRKLPGLKPVADDHLLKFTGAGKFVLQIGRSNSSGGNADRKNLHEPADAFVYQPTNEVFVADGYGNHRVIVFDADTGSFKRMWGAFGNKPLDADFCPSEDSPRVPKKNDEGPGPQQFDIVHAIRVSNDGFVYVADRENKRVQVFTIDGKFVTQVIGPASGGFAGAISLSADPAQSFLYVAAGSQIHILNRKTLKTLGAIGGNGILGGGHHMMVDLKGNIYTAQSGRGAQKLIFKGLSSSR